MTPCMVCTVHVEMRSTSFLVEPQNEGQWFVSGMASKPLGQFVSGLEAKPLGRFVSGLVSIPVVTVFSGLALKPVVTVSLGLTLKTVAMVSRFRHQNRQVRFGDLDFKITATVSWFVPQNQAGFGLSVAP
jgi:hypothetical protein